MQQNTTTGSWNEDNTARLRELWGEGLPAAEIGRRLGITKNAVIGKAWRLDLPPRRVPDSPNPVPSLAEIMPLATDQCHWPLGRPGTRQFPLLQSTGADRQALLRSPLSHRLCAPRLQPSHAISYKCRTQ